MKRIILTVAAIASTFANSPILSAAALDPKDVAAKPAILVHLDCDALVASVIGQSVLSDPDVQNKLTTVTALFAFDLRKQLHGLTVYTTEDHPKDGVLIVYADFDPDRLITLAKAADGSECATSGSHVIYSWIDKKKEKDDEHPRIYGAILGHRVVFGQSASHLANALDVIDGKSGSFTGKLGMPETESGESVIAQAVVLKFPFDTTDQNAAIFKMSDAARLRLSQVGKNMNGFLRLEAKDADTATQISAVAQGLLAILKLQKSDANLLELANAISIKQDGPAVALSVSLPTSELLDKIKAGEKKEEAKKEAKKEHETKQENN